jgi:nucleoredoxin
MIRIFAGALLAILLATEVLAGAILTRDRQPHVGECQESAAAISIRLPFGRVSFQKDTLLWYNTSDDITTFFQAARAAAQDGRLDYARIFLLESIEKEENTRDQARNILVRIEAQLEANRPMTTPAAPTTTAPPAATPAQPEREKSVFAGKIQRNLVTANTRSFSRFRDPAFETKEYFVLYFSASWCGPCRQFTPVLIQEYNSIMANHKDRVEFILVSSDRDAQAMRSYMNDTKMPWPAISFRNRDDLRQYGGRGIPCVAVLNAKGDVVAHSYSEGRYLGPHRPIQVLKEKLAN